MAKFYTHNKQALDFFAYDIQYSVKHVFGFNFDFDLR